MFPTSIAGSLPKPAWLAETQKLWPQWKAQGDELRQAKADATLLWIKAQEDAGLDIVTDGEQSRQHFVHGFLEQVEGIDFEHKVKMGIRDNRYDAMVPQVVAPLKLKGRVHAFEAQLARAHTKRKLKFTLPGPMTIIDTVADRYYGDKVKMAFAFAELLNQEALALQADGVDIIQFDEPAFNVYMKEAADWGVKALERAAQGLTCTTAVHICYGYGIKANVDWKATLGEEWRQYEQIFPALATSSIKQVSLECYHSHVPPHLMKLLEGKDVMVGVIDVASDTVETPEQVADTIGTALAVRPEAAALPVHQLRPGAHGPRNRDEETPGAGPGRRTRAAEVRLMASLNRAALARLRSVLQSHIDDQRIPGAIAVVALGDHVEMFESLGRLDPAAGTPMKDDAIFRVYSMTKPLVSLAALMLAEEGRLQLGDPVSKYLPEFANQKVAVEEGGKVRLEPARREATVHDLLRHTAGLTYEFLGTDAVQRQYEAADVVNRSRTNAEFCKVLAAIPLASQPGSCWQYSRATDVLGALLEVVSGQPLGLPAAGAHPGAAGHEGHGVLRAQGPVAPHCRAFRERSRQRQRRHHDGRARGAEVRIRRRRLAVHRGRLHPLPAVHAQSGHAAGHTPGLAQDHRVDDVRPRRIDRRERRPAPARVWFRARVFRAAGQRPGAATRIARAVFLERHRRHVVPCGPGRRPVRDAADAGPQPAHLLSQPVPPPGLRRGGLNEPPMARPAPKC